MPVFQVTAHMIIRNEDRFVWYAIKSVLPFVKELVIYDTGSTDGTVRIVEELARNFNKIKFKKIKIDSPRKVGLLRIQQVKVTKTPWFLIVDGDEIWPGKELIKLLSLTRSDYLPNNKVAIVNKFRDCVGDVWHYQDKSGGRYKLLGKTGHYTIRLMRTLDYSIGGNYPYEGYCLNGKLINGQDNCLRFCDAWYLHASFLNRSSVGFKGKLGKRKEVIEKGINLLAKELPKILFEKRNGKNEVLNQRSLGYEILALLITPLKRMKRYIGS